MKTHINKDFITGWFVITPCIALAFWWITGQISIIAIDVFNGLSKVFAHP